MAKKEPVLGDIEREYVIPLRIGWKRVPRYKRANKAIKTIKEFLVKHMRIRDRDLNKIKIDRYLNETVWARGIKKPPVKVKVLAKKKGDIVNVELVEYSEKLKFKKIREEKVEKKAAESIEKKKTLMEKAKEGMQQTTASAKPEEAPAKTEEKEGKKEDEKDNLNVKREEEKEKKTAVVEEGKMLEKQKAKQSKHVTNAKMKQSKRPQRKALAK